MPRAAREGDAGVDLHARQDVFLGPGQRALIPTGIAVAIPTGHAGFVHPRSGLAAKYGITIVNAPGLIDSGYRGEIMVNLLNTDNTQGYAVSRGDRIAQLVVQEVLQVSFQLVPDLPASERGAGGHGHTGLAQTHETAPQLHTSPDPLTKD